MKTKFFSTIIIAMISGMCFSQTNYWKTTLTTGEFGVLEVNFTLKKNGDFYFGTTPINAHKRIVGGIKSAFAKSMFQKDGSIAELDSISFKQDSIAGYLIIQKIKYHLKGTKKDNSIDLIIYGKLSGKTYGTLQATVVNQLEKPKDYAKVWQSIKSETEKYIYRKTALETKQWKTFVNKMDDFSKIAEDDAEFAFAFFQFSKQVGFSHYGVLGNKELAKDFHSVSYKAPKTKVRPELRQINETTTLLDIPAFNFRAVEIDSIMKSVVTNKPKNLIIDLRNNTGGDMEGGMRICQYLTKKTLYGGIMLSQNYWNKNDKLPALSEYKNFKPMNTANYEWFKNEVKNGVEGLCLITEPLEETYSGNIVILTSKVTASASEPFVYTLQKEKIATVIGEKTSGSVLSMEYFYIENLAYTIPMLDYYAYDGQRIDQIGVTPDLICDRKDALNIALESLNKK
jgi:hypothetical protein